jgi:nucleoside-diphosphate-sugar epimerase
VTASGNGAERVQRPSEVSLVTGFPSYVARRLVRRLVEADTKEIVHLLFQSKHHRDAEQFVAELPRSAHRRVRLLEGDICDMDLGLRGLDYRKLTADLTAIHHAASIHHPHDDGILLERFNVEGTRSMLEMAGDCPKLRRFAHWSTAFVSGNRSGVILEEELDCGQRFRNSYEETKYQAERLVRRAMGALPITILRPGIIVGDSQTGEIDRFEGPYRFLVFIISSPVNLRIPIPSRGTAPLPLVPIDFVVNAAVTLSKLEDARGGTFHLTDPCPLAARTVYEMVASRVDRSSPRTSIPTGLARALLRTPGLERLARAPLALFDSLSHVTIYNCRRALALLERSGVRCPAFDEYVDALVQYVQKVLAQHQERRREEQEIVDPFD